MVGPNTMLAATPWIKRNMLNVDPEQEKTRPTEAEMRVKRCAEKLQVPDWYRDYFKPDTKFLKDKTPFECRPPTWKSLNGKVAAVNSAKKSRTLSKESPPKQQTPNAQPTKPNASPRKSLNSNYRISRKAGAATRNRDRLSISITPTSSDNESDQQPVANEEDRATLVDPSKSLHGQLNTSNTFPRMQPSRKIQNINIVFPADFTPKPPRRQPRPLDAEEEPEESNESMVSSTPRTHYTLTRNIEVSDDCDDSAESDVAELSPKSNYASFLLAEVQPRGVTTTMKMFAGLDLDESDEHEAPARCSPSPHTRFFNSEKKSIELERIVQNSREDKRANNLIREIIGELDRSIAESMASGRRSRSSAEEPNSSGSFVKKVVRALENVGCRSSYDDDRERSYEEDSELAKSTSISFKSCGEGGSSVDEDEYEEESTPMPTYEIYERSQQEPEEGEQAVHWIPAKIHDLARTSSRLSVLSRNSTRSGFNCASGRCSPGLSPIKSDRARDEWTATLSSYRSQKTSRQLFRIDETGVADSGCYSDRSGATSQSTRTPAFSDDQSPSPVSSATPSPTLNDAKDRFLASDSSSLSSLSTSPTFFDGISTAMIVKMSRARPLVPLKSVRV